jgi:hypothetical protein
VLGFATGAWFGIKHPRGFGLADALTGVGFDGFGDREAVWLAFRHDKNSME